MPNIKSKRKYAIDNEVIMKKWDFEENNKYNINPSEYTEGSHQKAYFKCPDCGNKWYGVIRDAFKYNGCKVCMKKARSTSNTKAKLKNGVSLFISNPELEKEWDYEENEKINLNPEFLMAGTPKEANWICPNGHKYKTLISNRAKKGTGCKFCSGQAVLSGFNDLATTRPDLLKEWDYEENEKKGLTPQNVMRGSHEEANWICPFGHHYSKEIKVRCAGQGCTICSKESQTSFPEQTLYFYISKIFPDTINRYGRPEIDIFIPSLNFGIEYDGAYAHKNKIEVEKKKNKIIKEKGICLIRIKEITKIKKDTQNTIYCKVNSNNTFLNDVILKLENIINKKYNLNIMFKPNVIEDRIKIEEQYFSLRKQDSIAVKYPEIAKEWDYEKNENLNPEYVTCGAHRKYWWICPICKNSYQSSPRNRVEGKGCQICRGFFTIKGINDLETKYPELIKYWDYEKNERMPCDIKYTNKDMFWWKCNKGHSYQTRIQTIKKYNECLGCTKKEIHILIKGANDLLSTKPNLALDWNYQKNIDGPDCYTANSNKEVWWKCHKCGYEYKKRIYNRTNCPNCKKNKRKVSKIYD